VFPRIGISSLPAPFGAFFASTLQALRAALLVALTLALDE
jgi:hypothetical protein